MANGSRLRGSKSKPVPVPDKASVEQMQNGMLSTANVHVDGHGYGRMVRK